MFHSSFNVEEGYPDILLVSVDHVVFHVHQHRLLQSSQNNFAGTFPLILLPIPSITPLVTFPAHSDVLNITLHVIYNIPFRLLQPTLEAMLASIPVLKAFGIPLSEHVIPSKPLFQSILSFMPLRPMDVFISAAESNIEELAVSSSSYLLSFDLAAISDPMAERMGPIYLKRLFLLHSYRLNVLKTLCFEPPKQHTPTLTCCFEDQQALTRAWNLACSAFAWEGTPGIDYEDHF